PKEADRGGREDRLLLAARGDPPGGLRSRRGRRGGRGLRAGGARGEAQGRSGRQGVRPMRLFSFLFKAWAFIRRDLLIETSYRSAFILQFTGTFVSVGIFFFLSGMIHGMAPNMKGLEGGEYFPFILVGIAFYHYLTVALTSFASRVRNEQLTGTLEAMLVTP